jgi:alpha-galactosidase
MTTSNDFALIRRAMGWTSVDELPLRFQYGGREIAGWPAGVRPEITETETKTGVFETTVRGRMPDGLEIRVECVRYADFPVVEFTAFLTHCGEADSAIIDSLRLSGLIAGGDAQLLHGTGDTMGEDGYYWTREHLPAVLSPTDGTSCKGAFPYMRLCFEGWNVNLAIGWPTQWKAEIRQEPSGVQFSAGQKFCHTLLHPGETLRTPRLTLMAAEGGETRIMNLWRRWYFAHVMPRYNGQPLRPLLCLHYWKCEDKPEFTAATEENQLHALHEYIRNGLKPDVWWIDAGWYPCDYVWTYTGTWVEDKTRFPRGLRPIGEECERQNAALLLWFEPERVQAGSWLDAHRPEWLLKRTLPDGSLDNDRLLNLGDPACCDAMIRYISDFIQKNKISIYRQDFNFNPEPFWRANETGNRIGALENFHGQGYLRYWDGLLENNPGLLLDSCASGGRRNDMESMRRAVPLHYTDVGYGKHPVKQLQHRQMFEWIPFFRAHNMNWDLPDGSYDWTHRGVDEFAFHAALAPCLTDMTRFDAAPEAFALSRRMIPLWRRAAEYMLSGDFYPLTECRADAHDFYAVQFHCETENAGFVSVVSNVLNEKSEFLLIMQALSAQTRYRLTNAVSGEAFEYTGAQLAEGLPLPMSARSGKLLFYQAITQ